MILWSFSSNSILIQVMFELGAPYNQMEMASFMSCSKVKTNFKILWLYKFNFKHFFLQGYMGECGIRGGYAELVNFDPDVQAMLLKSISAKLCPTVIGQVRLNYF